MGRNSKILFVAFLILVAASVVSIYHRYFVLKDINFQTDEETFQAALLEE